MCGACGTAATWTERIAPLDQGGAVRRARALNALLAVGPPRLRRVKASPWPGGGWRLHAPDGWHFARSLDEAIGLLARRYGPLVAPDPGDASTEAPLPEAVPGHALVVWAVAVRHAGLTATVRTLDVNLAIDPSGVHATAVRPGAPDAGVLRSGRAARSLARHLEIACA
ncbi:hypothetical protein [Actinomadura rugatobispora]|uniref:Uncharacterized protein n=1 Tax=Actinomadura rugatobispora TaxID=1994 RepID=A0ABW0ZP52_9ACTN|nr:hypothetical protein GCM10010200_024000 [Actinomadura rugatobispora]